MRKEKIKQRKGEDSMIIKTKKEVKNWSKNFWKGQKKWFVYRFDEKELGKILKDVKRLHIKEIKLAFEKKERDTSLNLLTEEPIFVPDPKKENTATPQEEEVKRATRIEYLEDRFEKELKELSATGDVGIFLQMIGYDDNEGIMSGMYRYVITLAGEGIHFVPHTTSMINNYLISLVMNEKERNRVIRRFRRKHSEWMHNKCCGFQELFSQGIPYYEVLRVMLKYTGYKY